MHEIMGGTFFPLTKMISSPDASVLTVMFYSPDSIILIPASMEECEKYCRILLHVENYR